MKIDKQHYISNEKISDTKDLLGYLKHESHNFYLDHFEKYSIDNYKLVN